MLLGKGKMKSSSHKMRPRHASPCQPRAACDEAIEVDDGGLEARFAHAFIRSLLLKALFKSA
jgi:hypothetical protein